MEHIINTPIDSGSGDTLTVAFGKVNDNFDDIVLNYPTNTDLSNELSNYMQIGDEIPISQVTGLETALTNKVDVSSYNNDLLTISNDIIDINIQINDLNTEIDNLSFPDTYVTGGTYSSGTTIFTNNTGGTFSVTGYTTGGTGSGGYWYAENSTPPTVSPVATGVGSIALGDGAKALSDDMFVYGQNAGTGATNSYWSNFIGTQAGAGSTNAFQSNFIGHRAGENAPDANDSQFIGYDAGRNATNSRNSIFIGLAAGNGATSSNNSTFIGYQAGFSTTNAPQSIFIGSSAGEEANYASNSQFIGASAGQLATNAQNSIFIGRDAGFTATNSKWSNFFGDAAGYLQANASYSTLIGYQAGSLQGNINELGSNNIIIGTNVTLPSGSTNSVNIGGILFGSNTNSFDINNPTPPSIEPSINGRIGIGIVNPQATLHISGDTIMDGNLTANTISATTYYNLPGLSGDYLPLSGGTMFDNASITFDNTSQLREGTYDFGGQGGISQICSVGYENNWQSGINHIFDNNGFIRESSHCFNIIPDNTFDSTLRFTVGSRWVLDDGSIYICSDASVGAAVWSLFNSDIYVTGGTFSAGTTIFTNNSGGTFSVTGYTTGGGTFTGGTVSGATTFLDGLTANTISGGTLYGDGSNLTGISAVATEFVVNCRNQSGANMYRGQVVFISGSTGNKPLIRLAQANTEATSARTFGVLKNDINNNADGDVVVMGSITNLDTRTTATHPFTNDTLNDGDTVYLSPTTAGFITNVKPLAPNHIVYIGKVIRTSPTNGYIEYQIQNGSELDEMADVRISGKTNGDLLIYNSGTTLWTNGKTLTGNYAINGSISATTYHNLPQDIFVTGGTYSSGTTTFRNNTGGTFNVTGYYTGYTPGIDVFVTGGTYNSGTGVASFVNNTGGTFNVSGFNTGGGGGGLTITQVTGLVLSAASWTLVSGFYEYDLSDANITSTSVVDFIPDNTSMSTVIFANILPRTDSSTGSVKLYSVNAPSANIIGTINILK